MGTTLNVVGQVAIFTAAKNNSKQNREYSEKLLGWVECETRTEEGVCYSRILSVISERDYTKWQAIYQVLSHCTLADCSDQLKRHPQPRNFKNAHRLYKPGWCVSGMSDCRCFPTESCHPSIRVLQCWKNKVNRRGPDPCMCDRDWTEGHDAKHNSSTDIPDFP